MESLAWHIKQGEGIREDFPRSDVEKEMLKIAKSLMLPVQTDLPDDFMQFSHFQRAVKKLNWNASPGYPLMHRFPNNSSLFKVKDGIPDPERVEMVWNIVQARLSDKTYDHIRLFVKQEAHKLKKLEQKRWRLISSVSVVDQLIDQMLFSDMNDNMIENWFSTPLKVGWSPIQGGWRLLPAGQALAIDKSSWDWTVKSWIVQMVLELRSSLISEGPNKKQWLELATWRYKCLFTNPTFVTSGGCVMRQKNPGVMKSGCVNTITDNSLMQLLLHLRVCLETDQPIGWIWALGDDTLQAIPKDLDGYLQALNGYCIVKQADKSVEFAGFKYGKTIEPMYKGKHAYNMLHMDPRYHEDFRRAYQLLYHKSIDKPRMRYLFGPDSLDFDSIWDCPTE